MENDYWNSNITWSIMILQIIFLLAIILTN